MAQGLNPATKAQRHLLLRMTMTVETLIPTYLWLATGSGSNCIFNSLVTVVLALTDDLPDADIINGLTLGGECFIIALLQQIRGAMAMVPCTT